MAGRADRRTVNLGALCASIVLNVAFLASMAVGLRVIPQPPDTSAIQLTLLPPIVRSPAPTPKPPAPARAPPALKVLVRPPEPAKPAPGAPSAPSAVPAVIAPPAKAPGPAQADGVQATLKETVGCDDPDEYHLTKAQRAVCDERLVAHAKSAPNLGLNMAADKQAAFDRDRRCHDQISGAGVPAPDDNTGLGNYVQRLRDCGPFHR